MSEPLSLDIRNISIRKGAAAFSQIINPGEIVGLAGLDGHGQERFLEVLAGLKPAVSGEVLIGNNDRETPITGFRKAVANGIAYLPRDRRATGIFPTQSVLDNFAISTVGKDARFGLISKDNRRKRYEAYRERLSISAPRPEAPITTLSGGNQQTRGVDVATRHVLYDVFRDLAREGMTLVILSSEIEEILVLCQRVLVFRDHEVAAEMSGETMTTDTVIAAMFGRAA